MTDYEQELSVRLPSLTLDEVAYWFKLHLMLEELDPENAINPHFFWKTYHMLYQ